MTGQPGGIQPALTAEEWGQVSRASAGEFNTAPMAYGFSQVLGDRRHATAALCLYGQSFGFTAEDAELLLVMRDGCDISDGGSSGWIDRSITQEQASRLVSIADRIFALLPPSHP